MDSTSQYSVPESVQENDLITSPDAIPNRGHVDCMPKVNGSCSNECPREGVQVEQRGDSVNSASLTTKSPVEESPPMNKGRGLRRWRRKKRDVVKDATAYVDTSKVLKRVFSSSVNPAQPANSTEAVIQQNSEASLGSANVMRNAGVADGFVTHGSSLESRFAAGPVFASGADSENSEERSSKSSTAASAPRARHEPPSVSGHARDRNRVKNLSAKSLGSSAQRVNQGKGHPEGSKKPRGEPVKIEKENSLSSMESDLRSSNFVFMQGIYSANSNGKQSERSISYDEENSNDGHAGELESSEELQTGYGQENVGDGGYLSPDDSAADASWDGKEEKSANQKPTTNRDPLVESILTLQSVEEALRNELQKLGEIGKATSAPADSTPADPEVHESISSDKFDPGNDRQSCALESQVVSLTEKVKHLEIKLEEEQAMLEIKEYRVAELESILKSFESRKDEMGSTIELQQKQSREIEAELEELFKQKIEAEVVYLTLTRTVKKSRVGVVDEITLSEEQEALADEQAQMLNKLGETESKAETLKKQAEELEKYCENILGTEEMLKMQRRTCRMASCFCIQLLLLISVIWKVLQLSPNSGFVVPT